MSVAAAAGNRAPRATYRIQCNAGMPFQAVGGLGAYLQALGVSHVYLSPVFVARPGSPHGYDVVDPGRLNPELGGEEGFRDMAQALRSRGLGVLLDVVPNHLCVLGVDNPWWTDVLENGPSSPYASYFDIDWHPHKSELADKVLLPVLGEPYGRALAEGRLRAAREGGGFVLDCAGLRLPLAPKSWPLLLEPAAAELRRTLPAQDPALAELESVLTAIAHLPLRTETAPARVQERLREKAVIRRRLERLFEESAEAARAVDAVLDELNGGDRTPPALERLEALLDGQGYRLSYWRVASDEINYRRFFDINDLAAIRVEEPAVFEAVHALPLRLVEEGLVDGLRVDHVDGLYDPVAYLERLRAVPYVLVEKIVSAGESLPEWPVAGTTGYEFLNTLNGLFVDPGTRRDFEELYERFTGLRRDPRDVVYEAKQLVLDVSLSSELTALARRLDAVSEQHRDSRDFTLRGLEDALREVIACFPVYRTYVGPRDQRPGPGDAVHVRAAVAEAMRRNPAVSASVFDFISSLLLLSHPDGLTAQQRAERHDFVMRFQQLSGPVMAKGLEDTAFYRHVPLGSLCEVGAHPGAWATEPSVFHAFAQERQARWPRALSATSTHDTKRDEDVRARLNVLSEAPAQWEQAVVRFRLLLTGRRAPAPEAAPDGVDEYLFYQTAVATWPPHTEGAEAPPGYARRLQGYMLKAIREAKVHTSWVSPNQEYERAVERFVADALSGEGARAFLDELRAFVARVVPAGMLNAVSQVLLKVAAPGVPDFYQGTEVPGFRLVDPDNREPVDFTDRARRLEELQRAESDQGGAELMQRLLPRLADGSLKMHVTRRALACRARRAALFERGGYVPLRAAGERERHVVAFARVQGRDSVVAVAGRFFASLPAPPAGPRVWGDTALPLDEGVGEVFRDALTERQVEARRGARGPELRLGEVLASAPVALLERIR